MVILELNHPSDVLDYARKHGLDGEIIKSRGCGIEKLHIAKLWVKD